MFPDHYRDQLVPPARIVRMHPYLGQGRQLAAGVMSRGQRVVPHSEARQKMIDALADPLRIPYLRRGPMLSGPAQHRTPVRRSPSRRVLQQHAAEPPPSSIRVNHEVQLRPVQVLPIRQLQPIPARDRPGKSPALPRAATAGRRAATGRLVRSEEHTSELQSPTDAEPAAK